MFRLSFLLLSFSVSPSLPPSSLFSSTTLGQTVNFSHFTSTASLSIFESKPGLSMVSSKKDDCVATWLATRSLSLTLFKLLALT